MWYAVISEVMMLMMSFFGAILYRRMLMDLVAPMFESVVRAFLR